MIRWAEDHAARHWRDWTGRKARNLHTATITAPRHGHGRATLLISDGWRPPQVAVKLGWSDSARGQVTREHQGLITAKSELPSPYADDVPTPLDLVSSDEGVAMFTSALRGRRPVVPPLLHSVDRLGMAAVDRYLVTTMDWSTGLSRATRTAESPDVEGVKRYVERMPDPGTLGRLVDRVPAERAWQHGDPAPGNVVLSRHGVGLVDWEHASRASLPWHDLAYVVLVCALVAARQSDVGIVDGFDGLYREDSWCGDRIRRHLFEFWDHTIDVHSAIVISSLELASVRGRNNPTWHTLVNHLVSLEPGEWLRR